MAASRTIPRVLTSVLIAATLAFGAAGCRGNPQPVVRAEKPPAAKTAPEATPSPAPAPATPAAQEKPPVRDDAPVVVDPGVADDHKPRTLFEAAQAERKRRASAGEPIAVINDKNLHKHASKGQITVAGPKEKEKAAAELAPGDPRDEQYWRGRARDIRERWRQASDDVKKLEQRSMELRQKFYLESDTFRRDNQIKPDWDRVLDKLRQSRLDSEAAQKELAEFLEEGRTGSVMPGWLREGEDEEPQDKVEKREAAPGAQSIEPPIMETPLVEPPPGDRR